MNMSNDLSEIRHAITEGNVIRAVELIACGEKEMLAWAAIIQAMAVDQVKLIDSFLPFLPTDGRTSIALAHAARRGMKEVVEQLLPYSDPKADKSEALFQAASHGYLDIVNLLLPHSEPWIQNSRALSEAAKEGHVDVVAALIPYSNPKISNSEALRYAAFHGFTEVVKLLLPVSSSIQAAFYALPTAAKNGNGNMVAVLLAANLPDPEEAYVLALVEAKMMGHEQVAEQLISAILSLQKPRRFSVEVFNQASEFGFERVVEHILLVNGPGMPCSAALERATYFGQHAVVDLLIDHCDADQSIQEVPEEERPVLEEALERRGFKMGKKF
ncbi:ankyrin repeat domain-containing protein [Xanthomonas sp. 3498]|uniref:ankyrin repeat domain-containing protein n=1 Tax=Xanthomonas sp. 3498 TaxID=2663863 RepID=UPI00160BCD65|nr:ankyrin repeat domain-containing protein [Xanthomonas sp. 3498]MBB5876158.1 hypothetical protein [Xanthomonas sp. 3498]